MPPNNQTESVEEKPIIILEFKYKGKIYKFEDHFSFTHWDEEQSEWSRYWWEEGNGSCDCNRSILTRKQFPEIPQLKCNENRNEIELISMNFIPRK